MKTDSINETLSVLYSRKISAVGKLRKLADRLDYHFRRILVAKIIGSSLAAIGGIFAVLGLILSLVPTEHNTRCYFAGSVLGLIGGLLCGGSDIADAVICRKSLYSAEFIVTHYAFSVDLRVHLMNFPNIHGRLIYNLKLQLQLIFAAITASRSIAYYVITNGIFNTVRIMIDFMYVFDKTETIVWSIRFVCSIFWILVILGMDVYTFLYCILYWRIRSPHTLSTFIRDISEEIKSFYPTVNEDMNSN